MSNSEQTNSVSMTRMMSRAEMETVNTLCVQMQGTPGPLMPILHAVQKKLGFIPHDAVPIIARELNLSIAEVHGVVTFYHYFRKDRAGHHVVHLCRAEACQSRGAASLEAHAKRSLEIDFHGTTNDGAISLEPVYCLGNCALGPAIMIDSCLHGRVTTQRFDDLMAKTRSAAGRA